MFIRVVALGTKDLSSVGQKDRKSSHGRPGGTQRECRTVMSEMSQVGRLSDQTSPSPAPADDAERVRPRDAGGAAAHA